jgi:hypothetical protein
MTKTYPHLRAAISRCAVARHREMQQYHIDMNTSHCARVCRCWPATFRPAPAPPPSPQNCKAVDHRLTTHTTHTHTVSQTGQTTGPRTTFAFARVLLSWNLTTYNLTILQLWCKRPLNSFWVRFCTDSQQ